MTNEIAFFEGPAEDIAVIASAGVAISFQRDPLEQKALMPGIKPTVVNIRPFNLITAWGDIMPWGNANDLPQQMVQLYNQDTLLPQTLGKLTSMILGRGIMAVQETIGDDGEEKVIAVHDAEVNAFIDQRQTRRYLYDAAGDATWFFNVFPELIASKNRRKIVQIHALNAEECRWCRMTDDGELPYVYVNANYPHVSSSDSLTKKLLALDPDRYDPVGWFRQQRPYNVVYPVRYPTPGIRFYALPHHYSLIASGWLDVHQSIPALKKYVMKNQMSIKYHWKVDSSYWDLTFGDKYKKGTIDEKRAIKREWLKGMEKSLTNVDKTGNSIVTEKIWDGPNKAYKDLITVEAVKDNQIDGKYIDDNVEASAQIFYAAGLDPVVSGFMGGSKQGQRSGGSDKREGYLIALQMLAPFREMVLEPLDFIAEYNGWKDRIPNLKFKFRDTILTTLDTGAGTQKKLS